MIEIFQHSFFINAFIVGVLLGFSMSYFSVFVVQRRISFIGSGLAHSAFGGVALGLLLNIEPLFIAIPFTVIVSILIFHLQNRTNISTDALIGVLFSFAVALGIIFIAIKQTYSQDAYAYLFGSILTVNELDIILSIIIFLITLISFKIYWERWAYATFDYELALVDKIPVTKDNYIFSIFLGITIALSIKIIGIILISAFIVIPGATAKLYSTTFFKLTLNSIVLGILSIVFGLVISFLLDLPSGAVIILLQSIIFLSIAALKQLLKF